MPRIVFKHSGVVNVLYNRVYVRGILLRELSALRWTVSQKSDSAQFSNQVLSMYI